MISHFHYDPVWWNTQAAYTSLWTEDPPGRCRADQRLRPGAPPTSKWRGATRSTSSCSPRSTTSNRTGTPTPRTAPTCAGSSPRAASRSWAAPTTSPTPTSTSPETTIRNFVHGIGFQRDVLGADPAPPWQLDVFGHDPQFPGMAADAGLTSSSWARGPHHQWGPMRGRRRPRAHAVRQRVRVDRAVGPRRC